MFLYSNYQKRVFIATIHLFRHFSVVSSLNSDLTVPFYKINFFFGKKDISSVVLDFLYSGKLYGIPQISAALGPQRLFE